MDETSNVNDNQYVDVNETINQDNVATGDVAGNVAADDAATTVPDADLKATSVSGAGLGTAPETVRVNPAT